MSPRDRTDEQDHFPELLQELSEMLQLEVLEQLQEAMDEFFETPDELATPNPPSPS